MLGLAAWVLAACASPSGGQGGRQQAGDDAGPAQVALRYSQALFAGDFAAAARYVTPASRNTLLALTDGLRATSLTSRHLAVGSTRVTGSNAVATLTGTICSSQSTATLSPDGPSAGGHCLTNTDPHSANPAFQVELSQGPDGRWVVVFLPPSAGAGGPKGAAPPASAP